MKAPNKGDRIIHTDGYNNVHRGTVDLILSAQFVYISDNGSRKFCMFREDWKHETTKEISNKK
jgi:hypothetical protein